ncbi:MAG: 4Fe-4S dicluster domain-containing protein, partial [Thermocrispum sp.]
MQIFAIVVSLAVTVVAVALFAKAANQIIAVVRLGQPAVGRSDRPGARWATMLKETLGHTRMLQWSVVGAAHWFVFVGFGFLFFTLVTAYGQLFDPDFAIPLIGHFYGYEWVTEAIAWIMMAGIAGLAAYRVAKGSSSRRSRFFGSTMWQGYFVEFVVFAVGVCIVTLRGLEYAVGRLHAEDWATVGHFPLTFWIGESYAGATEAELHSVIWVVATTKIVVSMAWAIVLGLNVTMGVAWHRFTAWPNIWFKRRADGGTALGGLAPIMAGGRPIDFENIDELDEDTAFGVGAVEDFSWKGILDFTTCTECGRCQSQCPAWATEKPLSPKLFVLNLRDHAYAKAPYLQTAQDERGDLSDTLVAEAERPLIGDTDAYGVIDPDVLWSCTSCGACVQQCPVDIEHVDHIMDMRRYQVLVESNFPAELNQLFKGLENKGNPWNMSPNARMDWAADLGFEVKQVGSDVESLADVEWLFWV